MQKVRFWGPEHWRFRAEEARTVADQMTHEEAGRSCGVLPTTTTVSLRLPRSNSPIRKKERMAIDASTQGLAVALTARQYPGVARASQCDQSLFGDNGSDGSVTMATTNKCLAQINKTWAKRLTARPVIGRRCRSSPRGCTGQSQDDYDGGSRMGDGANARSSPPHHHVRWLAAPVGTSRPRPARSVRQPGRLDTIEGTVSFDPAGSHTGG